jgi:Fe-S oxidoreductase/nitrate reductase gamma subunit
MLTSLDLLLLSLAIVIMGIGFLRIFCIIRSGRPEKCLKARGFLVAYLLNHKTILRKPFAGTLHMVVFWGCVLPIIIIILAQTRLIMPGLLSSIISVLLDIMGILFLAAAIIFFVRRLISRDTLGPKQSLLPLLILIIILITGFLVEGIRLGIVHPENIWVSPVGYLLSSILPASPLLMQLMIRVHLYLFILLIALIPFTFFRHLIISPLNIIFKKQANRGELRDTSDVNATPGANHISDFTWKQILETEACVSCGRCEESCPAFISKKPLSPRKIVRAIHDIAISGKNMPLDSCISPDEIWACTTCMACVEACPVYVVPLDKIIEMRRHLTMGKGELPLEARPMIRALELYGDVNGMGASHRADWAMNRGVKTIGPNEKEVEIVIWTGCSGAFHPRYQDVSRALVSILQKAGINFRILGANELCCGDPARRLGDEELFISLAKKNLKTLREHNVNRIITLCPHCFNTLKNEYPKIETESIHRFEVLHAAQYVMELIEKNIITPVYPLQKMVTLHDPCYLGRANNIYEPLRGIINSIPGAEIKELERSREKGFCCGGGGGGMWLHEHHGKRINLIRSEEIVEKGIDMVCTACPYCQTMISDGINGLELQKLPQVLDIIEVVERALR